METTYITDETIKYVQVLTKCDISKEDLTDAVEYFRGKNIINDELKKKSAFIMSQYISNYNVK